MNENLSPLAETTTGLIIRPTLIEVIEAPHFVYNLTCIGADGQVKWEDSFHNLVTTAGKNDLLNVYFRATTAPGSWFIGLISTLSTGVAAGDTMASKAWTEFAGYSQGTRPALSFAAASAGSTAATAAAFSITSATTVNGCFSVNNSTKSGTTGTLYSAGTFTARAVENGDTLNVTLTLSV